MAFQICEPSGISDEYDCILDGHTVDGVHLYRHVCLRKGTESKNSSKSTIEIVFFYVFLQYSGDDVVADLQMPLLAITFPLTALTVYFYIGQKFHTQLYELSYIGYETEWYRYSSHVRRFLLLMIMRSQQPFYLSAYGIMELRMQNYINVSQWRWFKW